MKKFKRLFGVTLFAIVLGFLLAGCRFTIDTAHAESNLRDFATRTHTFPIDCSNQDSDKNNYLTCVIQEEHTGSLIAVECPWRPYNTGCRLSKQYTQVLTSFEARDILQDS